MAKINNRYSFNALQKIGNSYPKNPLNLIQKCITLAIKNISTGKDQ